MSRINVRNVSMFAVMALLFVVVGEVQSWSLSLAILNLCLISAIMSLGVNIQWGYAGLLNVGIMGFAALGGLAGVLVSTAPVPAAWEAGGGMMLVAGLFALLTIPLMQNPVLAEGPPESGFLSDYSQLKPANAP